MQGIYPYFLGPESDRGMESVAGEETLVVRLVGEFDRYSEPVFLGCIRQLLAEGHDEVCFDFSEVRFVDTAGLRCLFHAQRQFRRAGRQLQLTGLPAGLERILRMVSAQAMARAVEDPDASPAGLLGSLPA